MARASVHGEATDGSNSFLFIGQRTDWVGTEKQRRVHREATEYVVFIRSQPAWMEQPIETRPGIPQNGGNGLVFDRPWSKRDPVHQDGSGVLQNRGNRLMLDLLWSKRVPLDREGCGVPQNGGNKLLFDLLRSKRGSCSSGGVWHTTK